MYDVNDKGVVEKHTASKITQVQLNFDVTPTGQVSCNDVLVPLGVSTVKVTTIVAGVIDKSYSASEVGKAFDQGLVSVQLTVKGQQVTIPELGVTVQRLMIIEDILEIDGKKVEQTQAMQQVIDLHPDGSVKKHQPCAVGDMKNDMSHMHGHPLKSSHKQSKLSASIHKSAKWFHKQSTSTKLATAFLFGSLIGIIALTFVRIVLLLFFGFAAFSVRHQNDDEEDFDKNARYLRKVSMYEDALPEYKQALVQEEPEYSKGYAKVQTDEQ